MRFVSTLWLLTEVLARLTSLLLRCDIDPSRVAVWWSEKFALRLSAFAAQALLQAGVIKEGDLEIHRSREYDSKKEATGVSECEHAPLPNLTSTRCCSARSFHRRHVCCRFVFARLLRPWSRPTAHPPYRWSHEHGSFVPKGFVGLVLCLLTPHES